MSILGQIIIVFYTMMIKKMVENKSGFFVNSCWPSPTTQPPQYCIESNKWINLFQILGFFLFKRNKFTVVKLLSIVWRCCCCCLYSLEIENLLIIEWTKQQKQMMMMMMLLDNFYFYFLHFLLLLFCTAKKMLNISGKVI